MQLVRLLFLQSAILLTALLALTPLAVAKTTHKKVPAKATAAKASSSHKTTTASHWKSRHGKKTVAKKSWKSKGQHTIASERTHQIQEALIREHYLDGEANGQWDTRTQEACRRYQAANGWQSKVLPDSRALIKLGLGPDHSNVLNPETAATSPYLPGGGVRSTTPAAMAPTASVVR